MLLRAKTSIRYTTISKFISFQFQCYSFRAMLLIMILAFALSAGAVTPTAGPAPAVPTPLINQPLVPDAASPGSGAFTLTVNGTHFVPNSTVNWNGAALVTTFVNSNQLTASVPAANVAVAGTASITVVNAGAADPVSNVIYFPIAAPTTGVGFGGGTANTGTIPYAVATGDFNGDGKPDLAVANFLDNTISILLGQGDGTFLAQTTYPTGSNPYSIAIGDFNGDGKLDLAVANTNDNAVSILLGQGDGTFLAQATYPTGANPISIAIGDFNGDGKLDLAVANTNDNAVSILLGQGDGTFVTQASTNLTGTIPVSIVTGDFNGDGKLDLVVANNGDNTLSILLGQGDGTFSAQTTYPTGAGPQTIAVADFNGDGKLDLAITNNNNGDNTVSILLGLGDGTFLAQTTYPTGSGPFSLSIGDLNGDGKLDLAVGNNYDQTVSILLGQGDGTFLAQTTYPTGAGPQSMAVADFNGDGKLDLAVADYSDNTVSILLHDNPAAITSPASGSSLTSRSATFTWNAGVGNLDTPGDEYAIHIGTTPGGSEIDAMHFDSSTLSYTTYNLPGDGSTVYVRLFTHLSGQFVSNDYTFTSCTCNVSQLATIISPAPGSTLATTTQTFTWNAGTGSIDEYAIYVGSTGPGTLDQGAQHVAPSGPLSYSLFNLPRDGRIINVRLWTHLNGQWQSYDYTYQACTCTANGAATISSPVQGATFATTSQTFTWNAAVGSVDEYAIYAGTTLGGADLGTQHVPASTLSYSFVNLPGNGSTVFIRLFTHISGQYLFNDYSYTSCTCATSGAATMASPVPGTTLNTTSPTFTWNAGAGSVDKYAIHVGSTPGGKDLGNPQFPASSLTGTVPGLPNNGTIVYVRLWTHIPGQWIFNNYIYTSCNGC